MKRLYRKMYFEDYAAQTLKLYLQVDVITHRDRPDLMVPKYHMGIEVTQAIKADMVFHVETEKMYHAYLLNPFDQQAYLNKGSIEQYLPKIEMAILRKIKKSQQYEKFTYNGLYIFTHCFLLNEVNIKRFFEALPSPIVFYDTVYLNGIHTLYGYDVKKKTLSCMKLASEDLLRIHLMALHYEQKKERELADARTNQRKND